MPAVYQQKFAIRQARLVDGIVFAIQGPKRWRSSRELMNAFTISALTKSPLKPFSLFSQFVSPYRTNERGAFTR